MRAGNLDREITLQRLTETLDAYGVPHEAWTTLAVVRAQVLQASMEEFRRAQGTSTETTTVFRIRYVDGLTVADRVLYAGQVHDVKELKEIGRRRGLDLRTIARGLA
ncbi:MAG TPA: phage head closure protein [Beijerinckiaceae bacterium]|jgi:SPP1 family predicted phage head-tail adaptor